ncbi:DUF2459 domain-containing protein [Desulfosediminicola flagellatus]|uniref:DUF2459 domain-containing protein n=1 Tax=Desulfosediminicola flagellatus TaxID=2569541 RepID=UPI0010AC0311|nr:DUF2459 domain-containing protein [Desulfosediminicola flagellatus]
MRWLITKALLFLMVIMTSGCTIQPNPLFPPLKDEQTRSIFLVNHGWHAGIVIRRIDIRQPEWPSLNIFTHMDYLEIGWGDKDYYTSPDPGPGLAVKALLLPTSSVLHLVGFRGPPKSYFPHNEMIRIELSVPGFEQMIHQISKSFSRDKSGTAVRLGPGNYGYSWFYASEETYHLCKTCNTWSATILQTAGCPITHASTVNSLMSQARRFGKVILEK